jgi:hypothetical protein
MEPPRAGRPCHVASFCLDPHLVSALLAMMMEPPRAGRPCHVASFCLDPHRGSALLAMMMEPPRAGRPCHVASFCLDPHRGSALPAMMMEPPRAGRPCHATVLHSHGSGHTGRRCRSIDTLIRCEGYNPVDMLPGPTPTKNAPARPTFTIHRATHHETLGLPRSFSAETLR